MEQGTEQYPSLWRAPEPEPTYEPPQSPIREDRGIFKRLGGGIVALGALLAKLKVLFLLLPKAKILTTAGTMLVSLAAYAWLFGGRRAGSGRRCARADLSTRRGRSCRGHSCCKPLYPMDPG